MDCQWIAGAAVELGYERGIALSTEIDWEPIVYEVAFTQEELLDFSAKFSYLNFMLVPEDLVFAILKEARSYFIVAGSAGFVRRAVGSTFKTAGWVFEAYAEGGWDEPERRFLRNVAERYKPFAGSNASIR